MNHYTSSDFWTLYWKLPVEIRNLADKNFELLKANPYHFSLQLKRIGELWSVRVGQHYRDIGIDAI
jgi:hypothetical protein